MMNQALFLAATFVDLGVALFIVVYQLATQPLAPRHVRGNRGLKRSRALERGGSFAKVEPVIRYVAGLLSNLPLSGIRARADTLIARAGDYHGFTPDEFLASMALLCILFTSACILVCNRFHYSPNVVAFAFSVGTYVPYAQLRSASQKRAKDINRGLPAAIDLAALCMGAGLDFVGSLRQIILYQSGQGSALKEELARILQELELGHTRKQALTEFAQRVPTEAVKDFVSAVIQSEEKGNPLADVLRIQATMLRMRRSVSAEEAAARAGALMMIPLTMILGSILIVLFGPFVINNLRNGF